MTTMWKAGVLAGAALLCAASASVAQDKGKTEAAELASESQAALQQLYANVPLAKELGPKAHAILVFPKVTKAGLGIGGQYGEGTLLKGGKAVAYYKTTGRFVRAAGGRPDVRLRDVLHEREGSGGARQARTVSRSASARASSWWTRARRRPATTRTMKDDIYAFIFGQKGLMAGLGIQGNKITKITPK